MNSDHRRARLKELLAKRFKNDRQAFLLRAKPMSKGRLTQLLDKDETFGERAARALEAKLHLPAMWFDVADEALPGQPNDGRLLVPVTLEEEKLLMYFKALAPVQRQHIVSELREQVYAKSVTEQAKGSPVKNLVSNVEMEQIYGLPRSRESHPK